MNFIDGNKKIDFDIEERIFRDEIKEEKKSVKGFFENGIMCWGGCREVRINMHHVVIFGMFV